MEARKRAMQKRKKLRTLGKSRSTESEDEEDEEEGMLYHCVKYDYDKADQLKRCPMTLCFLWGP